MPEHQSEQQQRGSVSVGNTVTQEQEAQYYEARQNYNPQYFEEGLIEELPDYHDNVGLAENKAHQITIIRLQNSSGIH